MICITRTTIYIMVFSYLLQGHLGVSSNVTYPSMSGTSTPTETAPIANAAVHLYPEPVASVERGYPLILTINIVSADSWRLEWSTSATGEVTLGSAKSRQLGTCQESTPLSEACLINSTSVRFSVENPVHGDYIYCAVMIPGTWNPNQTTLTASTEVYVQVPLEYVHLQYLSGESSEGQLIVKEGDNITLRCETSPCRPNATILWMKDGAVISSLVTNSTISIENGLLKTSEKLMISTARDSILKSAVQCVAVNYMSNNMSKVRSKSLEIIILRVPPEPTAMSVAYIDKTSLNLSWSIDPLSLYRLTFDISVLPNTAGLAIGSPTRQNSSGVLFSSMVLGLQPNTAYNISVTASNDVGTSSAVSTHVTIFTEAQSGLLYFHLGVALMAVSVVLLVTFGVCVVIKLKRDVVPFKIPRILISREGSAPDPMYEDLENLGKCDAPVIEKRLKNARKTKGELKATQGLVSGMYNSIGSSIEDGIKKESPGNIYDDIPGASVFYTRSSTDSSSSPKEGKVQISVPKIEKQKQKPPILKKPPSRKYKNTVVVTVEDVNRDPEPENPATETDTHAKDVLPEVEEEPRSDDSNVGCQYMEMKGPDSQKDEYVDVHKLKETLENPR
ncbi:uncharacterized protein [Argopecten irradians]|uniref:uncharacterized protein isoform X2 n=1 Tax=Argopecten irradians TaxID=31199 RepID=UPI003717125B